MEKLNISLKMVTGHFSFNLGETQGFLVHIAFRLWYA